MAQTIEIGRVESPEAVRACYPVMRQLRPHLEEEAFLEQVRRQQAEGYHLVALRADGEVRGVAGFRMHAMLSRGLYLYVDDLVTDESHRSAGYGHALLNWLKDYARQAGCQRLDLDSGVQRAGAHRFYFREGLHIASYHFTIEL